MTNQEYVADLLEALKSDDEQIALLSVSQLSQLNLWNDTIVTIYLHALSHRSKQVCYVVAHALAKIASPRTLKPFIEILETNKDVRMQMYAAIGLGNIGDKIAVPPLINFLKLQRSKVVERNTGVGETGLTILLEQEENNFRENARSSAVTALGKLKDEQAVDVLLEALRDPSSEVRCQAIYAVEQFEDARILPALDWVAKNDTGYYHVTKIAQVASEAIVRLKA